MLITSDRKASPAKRAFIIVICVASFGAALFTKVVDNAPIPATDHPSLDPIRSIQLRNIESRLQQVETALATASAKL